MKIRHCIYIFVTVVIFLCIVNNHSEAAQSEQKIESGTYFIKSAKNEEYVFSIAGASSFNYGNLEIDENQKKENQKFNLKSTGESEFSISVSHSDKYLDIHVSSTVTPNNVIQYNRQDYVYQKWIIKSAGDGYYYIISKYNGLYMDIENGETKDGSNICLKPYSGNITQKFKLEQYKETKINIENGTYKIASAKDEDYVFDIAGALSTSYANLQIGEYKEKENQKFNLKLVGDGVYTFSAEHSDKYLDIQVSSKSSPNNVIQYSKKDYIYQKWMIKSAGDGYCYIISKYNGLYMDIEDGEIRDGANIALKPYSGNISQKFKLDLIKETKINLENGTYQITSAQNKDLALNIVGALSYNYANLEIAENKGKENQKFSLKSVGDGTYTFSAVHSGKYLDIHVSSMITPNNIIQYSKQDYIYQKWIIKSAGDGYCYIVSKYNGLYMDIDGEEAKNGANIALKPYSGKNSQKFKIEQFKEAKVNIENGIYKIASARDEEYFLNIAGDLTVNYANLEIGKNKENDSQKFNLKSDGEGAYTFCAEHSNKYLDIQMSSITNPNNIIQYSRQDYIYQKWMIKSAGDGYYYIVSKYNGLYLDIEGGNIRERANVALKQYTGESSQKFKIVPSKKTEKIESGFYSIASAQNSDYVFSIAGDSKDSYANLEMGKFKRIDSQGFNIVNVQGGAYTISAGHSYKNLDIHVSSSIEPNNVIQYRSQDYIYQKWIIKPAGDGFYYIISSYNGLYMDTDCESVKEKTNVSLKQFSGKTSQKFKLVPFKDPQRVEDAEELEIEKGIYTIASANNSSYVLDIAGVSDSNYANLQIWQNEYANNQKFSIISSEKNEYTISAGHSNKYLDIQLSTATNIIQYQYQGYIYQKWIIKYAGDGYYYIVSKYNGLCMDIDDGMAKNGANVSLKKCNGSSSQQFKLIKTTISDAGRSSQFKREHPEVRIGIDVSKYQGTIDWNAVKSDGIDYVMIRAGYRGYGEGGTLVEDPKFDEYVRGAKSVGIDVGVYFFSQAMNYTEGVTEANYTLSLIKKYNITYPIAFDTEESSSPTNTGRADGISTQARTDAAKGFCSTIRNAGYNVLIYASPSWLKNKLYLYQLSEYDIWLANYTGATQENPLEKPSGYKGKYIMWQYTDSGTVNGINGKVDCNLLYYF